MEDVIIIGAGPAGLSAAIYTARAQLSTLAIGILENSNAHKAHVFENYMGFENQISGPYLMGTSLKQAQKFGAKFLSREVVELHRKENPDGSYFFSARDTEQEEHEAKTIIICSGLGFKPSGIKREKELTGRGISFCVTCDGPFFKNKKVVVVGNTNFAGAEALELLIYTSDVMILSHGKDFSISEKMKQVLEQKRVKLMKTSKIQSFEGETKLEKLKMSDGTEMEAEGVFVALGVAGAADFANQLGLAKTGPQNAYIVADPKTGATNIPGIYAAGDCTGGNAQAAKSSGEGCNAALSVIKLLKGLTAYVDYS